MKRKRIYILIAFGILFLGNIKDACSQGRRGYRPDNFNQAPGQSNPNNPKRPTGVPIDGGAGILLAAGAAYGLKKLRNYHKSRKGT